MYMQLGMAFEPNTEVLRCSALTKLLESALKRDLRRQSMIRRHILEIGMPDLFVVRQKGKVPIGIVEAERHRQCVEPQHEKTACSSSAIHEAFGNP